MARRIVFSIIAVGLLAAAAPTLGLAFNRPAQSIARETSHTPVLSQKSVNDIGIPIRLRIPAINVNSAVEPVGITPGGVMDIKENQDNTAWYKYGPRPGENGNAVIAGHYGWDHQKPSVFTQLSKLQEGDKLYVDSDKRTTIAFVIRKSKRYNPDADTTAIFKSNDGNSHLNLITCDGSWDEAKKSYTNRLVVFADRT
ncbi:MAG TPA: class F sortase [Candidatus Saccharimonadales bacterium]|nr:class F sortase [Candidatus Saccharimonadales bacterium]